MLDWLTRIIEPIHADRAFGLDIERLIEADWPAASPPIVSNGVAPLLT